MTDYNQADIERLCEALDITHRTYELNGTVGPRNEHGHIPYVATEIAQRPLTAADLLTPMGSAILRAAFRLRGFDVEFKTLDIDDEFRQIDVDIGRAWGSGSFRLNSLYDAMRVETKVTLDVALDVLRKGWLKNDD